MEERAYPIQCSCGAVVRVRAWALHLKYGDPSREHTAPRETQTRQDEGFAGLPYDQQPNSR